MTKRKKNVKRTKKKISFFQKYKKTISFFILLFIAIPIIYLGYNYILNTQNKHNQKNMHYLNKNILIKMNKMLQTERKKVDILNKELQKIKNKQNKYSSESIDFKKNTKNTKNTHFSQKHKIIVNSKKPFLAIIMDDVSFQYEVNDIKKIPFKITPSIFPPTKRHPNTPKLAKEFKFYMVHLPLEAYDYPNPEPKTLLITSSLKDIQKRIANIKKWFPKDKFINNHTGSKFTSNYEAMMRLFTVLKQNNIVFIDSRTTAKTVAPEVAKSFNEKLLSRNVFLDNKANINYIKGQLEKAVKLAEKNGYAIAICHPHRETFKALMSSKDILKPVKLVYIKEIYENSTYSTK